MENNGVVYGKHDRLFEKYQSFSEEQLKKNLAHLKAFLERHPSSTFAIVPSSYTVYPQDLPAGLQQVDQSAEIETIRQELSDTAENLDLLTLLQSSSRSPSTTVPTTIGPPTALTSPTGRSASKRD